MIGLLVFAHPMSGERVASEVFWWTNPEARGVHGVKLLRMGEEWARTQDVVAFHMIAPDVRVGSLYARRGYREVETVWEYRFSEVTA
jgi:hypothetical protein